MKSECEACGRDVGGDPNAALTPRQLVGLDISSTCTIEKRLKVSVVIAIARGIISYDNPPGGADRPMFSLCQSCRKECLTIGNYNKNLTESERLKRLIEGDE